MPFKTTVTWLLNDIWCFFVIGCFDLNIGISQFHNSSKGFIVSLSDNNGIRAHNHLVRKRTLNPLAKLA